MLIMVMTLVCYASNFNPKNNYLISKTKKMIKSHNKNITHFMCYAKYSVTQEKTQVIKCNAKIAKSTTAGHFIA